MSLLKKDPLSYVVGRSKGRMYGDGIQPADLEEILTRCKSWDEWYRTVMEYCDRYERMAEERLAGGHSVSAGELYWRACIYAHYSQFYLFDCPNLRELGHHRKTELYRRAAPLFFPPAERLEIPFAEFTIPGYLRLPPDRTKPPCVVLIGGLDGTKEESFLFERMCLDRGMATFAFDGPGQGEMFFQTKIRGDFERFTSAVLDHLETRTDIDPLRFGVLGRSLGGHYAAKSAAHDERFQVCVCWGALYELQTYWEDMHPLSRLGFTYCSGETDPDKGKEALKIIDLAGWTEKIRCSLYIQHGMKDDLIPFSQALRLEKEAINAREVVTQYEPEGNHCCHNLSHTTRYHLVDHLAKVLRA